MDVSIRFNNAEDTIDLNTVAVIIEYNTSSPFGHLVVYD